MVPTASFFLLTFLLFLFTSKHQCQNTGAKIWLLQSGVIDESCSVFVLLIDRSMPVPHFRARYASEPLSSSTHNWQVCNSLFNNKIKCSRCACRYNEIHVCSVYAWVKVFIPWIMGTRFYLQLLWVICASGGCLGWVRSHRLQRSHLYREAGNVCLRWK